MICRRSALLCPVLVLSTLMEAQSRPITLEGLPDRVQARLEVKERAAANAAPPGGFGVQYFMYFTKRRPNTAALPITVAFLGGSDALRRQIMTVASEWANYGNIAFSFIDPQTNQFREWTRSDTTFKADIRVAFDGVDGGGYWSLVGTDSSDSTIIAPNEASLELQGFTTSLSADWQAIVRHEFGHALGLMHEHQMPIGGCDQDFRWNDDPGYIPTQDSYGQYINDSQGRKPGIYTLLAGAPNYWPKDKVDRNMRQLVADSHNYDWGPFDASSIMKYYFDDRMFRDGINSHCYSQENMKISQEDQTGIGKWYPPTGAPAVAQILNEQTRIKNAIKASTKMKDVQTLRTIK